MFTASNWCQSQKRCSCTAIQLWEECSCHPVLQKMEKGGGTQNATQEFWGINRIKLRQKACAFKTFFPFLHFVPLAEKWHILNDNQG